MTNLEMIQRFSLDEMAKFIAEHDKNCDIADGKYCSEICDQRVKGRCKHDDCVRLELTEEDCVRAWLMAEANSAPTIEPSVQVTGKLKNPCDSLLTEDSEDAKEQKSKLDLIRGARMDHKEK